MEITGCSTCAGRDASEGALVAGACPFAAAVEYDAATAAEMCAVLRHARGDTLDVGNVLAAEALCVALAGRALLRGTLGGGRNGHKREGAYDGKCQMFWRQVLHASVFSRRELINLQPRKCRENAGRAAAHGVYGAKDRTVGCWFLQPDCAFCFCRCRPSGVTAANHIPLSHVDPLCR